MRNCLYNNRGKYMILYIKNVLGGQNIKNEAGEILYSIKQEKFIGSTKLLFKDEKIIYKAEILNENEKQNM